MPAIDVIFTVTSAESPIIDHIAAEKLVENRKRPGKLQIVDIAVSAIIILFFLEALYIYIVQNKAPNNCVNPIIISDF